MFNNDFYPTPNPVIDQMIAGLDLQGKNVLESSAGKGDIVDVLNEFGANVLTYEKDKDLARIIESKSTFLGYDFLQSKKQDLSHLDYIIMNPPFSRDEAHILHAWEIAPEGCQIISLCNTQTLDNRYSMSRKQLAELVHDHGDKQELGDCFATSERKTGVEVSMVKLFKPIVSQDFDYEGFYMDADEDNHVEGVMRYSEIRSVVSRYIAAVKCFDEFQGIADTMNGLVSPIGLKEGFSFSFGYNESVTTKEAFSKKLQKRSWKWIFDKMNIGKFVTSGVMKDINSFVESQQQYPFTMKNIYRMLEIIIGSRDQIMNKALVEAFDKITRHYDENRFAVEGWKTNSHYLINKKFILPFMVEQGWSGEMNFRYHGNTDALADLNKALGFITGKSNDLEDLRYTNTDFEFHQWHDWGFFEIKGFKKGSLHCKFKDEKVWWLFNQAVAKIKGYPLPEKVRKEAA